ncbi:MAG: histidinol-phosphate aminotransferase [Bacteroidetes bacterium]|nr:MAG: histidinol-phosphate aminotransferase [Bacteroidota bacterium]
MRNLIRPHLHGIVPYSTARDESKAVHGVFLDANENPYKWPYNRYPDPLQKELRKAIAELKQMDESQVFIGNGSDEIIDLLIRVFCEPGKNSIMVLPPTYGMYAVSARAHNIRVKEVQLDDEFQPHLEGIAAHWKDVKLIFLCSPNNPTGNKMDATRVLSLLETFDGVVVIDEAYSDYSESEGFKGFLSTFPRLVIMQTFSKAWSMASARIGIALTSSELVSILNKVKLPYNINNLSANALMKQISKRSKVDLQIRKTINEREKLFLNLQKLPFVVKVFRSEANFLLVKVTDAERIYNYLSGKGIIVRNRSSCTGLDNCLRITIGTNNDNKLLMKHLNDYNK